MALKIALIDGYVFQPHDTLQPLDFENVIHHQEWRAVRQNFLDANAVKNHLMASRSVRKSMVETAGATLSWRAASTARTRSRRTASTIRTRSRRAASTARSRSPGLQAADARHLSGGLWLQDVQPTPWNYMRNTPPNKRG